MHHISKARLHDRAYRSPRPWLVALAFGVALAVVAATDLWQLRRDAVEAQARELGLLSLALTDEIGRGLQGAQEGLHAVQAELREGRLRATGIEAERALRVRAELMPMVRTLWLVGEDGRLLSSSDPTPLPHLASFAPDLNRLADGAIAVSRPSMDLKTQTPLVTLAVRFASAPNTQGGWVMAAMPASALLGAFSVASPAADARMAVFRSDGVRLAGSLAAKPTLDETSAAEPSATLRDAQLRQFRDGSERLVELHGLPPYGLKVVVTRDMAGMLASWRGAARLTSAALLLLLSVIVGSVYLVQRADGRRAAAQQALQLQQSRASKLKSLGTLAGGVAHDFNNVLAAIVGYGEMAQDAAPQGSHQRRHLDHVLQAALRGKALVERILAFSRGSARTSTVFELEPIVEEVLTLLAASLRPGMVLERALEAHAARLRGDPTQAFEAVMNLCTNAMQAMPGGGMLGIRLERVHVAEARVLSHSELAGGHYLALTVSDQGAGITPEVMERLFEPFFTTHEAQSGTGLGLAVVHGVVAEFGGAIDVQSAPGQGARFTLYFPECTDALDARAPATKAAPCGAGQTLLVVDDEPALVALAEELLKGLGYQAVGFCDPVAAMQALRADLQRFSAVITDEVMPGLSGTQLTESLRLHAPHLPVLLVSGFGGALLASRAAAAGVTRVLSKPLQRTDLAHALAELLH